MIRTRDLRSAPPEPADGLRVLVSRYYPRGIPRSRRLWDLWYPELGPSRELHAVVKSGKVGWDRYEARYRREMAGPQANGRIRELAARHARGETLTLLCDHARGLLDERCHRHILRGLIEP